VTDVSRDVAAATGRYLNGDYLAHNPDWHVDDSPWKVRHVTELLNGHGIVPRDIADIGCGSGACAQLIHEAYSQAPTVGFEIAPDAFAVCRKRESPGLHYSNAMPFDDRRVFDLAMVLDVVEHVENPFAFVRSVAQVSRYQVFHIPLDMNAMAVARGWPITKARQLLGHLSYFNRESALALLREAGLEVVEARFTAWAIELAPHSAKRWLAVLPRRIAYALNPDVAVRLLGGWSLMVLTRSDNAL